MERLTDAEWDERVKVGADWLNEIKPGWLDLIDLPTLDMLENCILDQVFAFEARVGGRDFGFLWVRDSGKLPFGDIARLGFSVGYGLKGAWERLVRKLRDQDEPGYDYDYDYDYCPCGSDDYCECPEYD